MERERDHPLKSLEYNCNIEFTLHNHFEWMVQETNIRQTHSLFGVVLFFVVVVFSLIWSIQALSCRNITHIHIIIQCAHLYNKFKKRNTHLKYQKYFVFYFYIFMPIRCINCFSSELNQADSCRSSCTCVLLATMAFILSLTAKIMT